MKKFIFGLLSMSLLIVTFTGSAFAADSTKSETKLMQGDKITLLSTKVISGDYDNMQTIIKLFNEKEALFGK